MSLKKSLIGLRSRQNNTIFAPKKMDKEFIAKATLKIAEQTEKAIDDEIERLDNLTRSDLEELRKKRMQQLKKQAEQKREWLQKGHGVYTEIHDQRDWFTVVKENKLVVSHFYRPTTWRCQIVDKVCNDFLNSLWMFSICIILHQNIWNQNL